MMKNFLYRYKLEIIGLPVGGFFGWLYWFYVGCDSGSCAISSNPVNSSIYGAILGALVAGLFRKEKVKQKT
jgi:hypothetical protein